MNERLARRLVRERSGGICEVCAIAYATNFHHRKNRSQGGRWTPENGLDVCGSGSTGCHGFITANPKLSYEYGWAVRSRMNPELVAVRLAGRGWTFLDSTGAYLPITADRPGPPVEAPPGGPGNHI